MLERKLRLIGYVRLGDSVVSGLQQLNTIKEYCRVHEHKCVAVFYDNVKPAFGLARAIDSLNKADGLITYDAGRLVNDSADTRRELRLIVEEIFKEKHKKLITVADGLENVTASGQENLMELIGEWCCREEMPVATYNVGEHERFSRSDAQY